jgi:catechol 2,3-dioxygenase-like lactoylglutathione lyase family enzyme
MQFGQCFRQEVSMNHLQLGSLDPEKTRRFYESYFGFRPTGGEHAMSFLENDAGFVLSLRKLDAPQPLPAWFHIGLRLQDPNAVRELHGRMRRENVRFARDIAEGDGWVAFYCYDPDGTTVEVSWDRPTLATG